MKPKIAKVASPAAIALLRQATALAPLRKKASDGLLPSAAHIKQSPNSDHNTGLAVDLTHDPKHGIDCAELYLKFREDERVSYLIFNGRIWAIGSTRAATRILSISMYPSRKIRLEIPVLGSGGETNQNL